MIVEWRWYCDGGGSGACDDSSGDEPSGGIGADDGGRGCETSGSSGADVVVTVVLMMV